LPDITLIAPVFMNDKLIAYVANRAHHAEIGGKTPGSMPPDATTLDEEGIIIIPQYLMHKGKINWAEVKDIFSSGKYPSRAVEENIADLQAAVASLQAGKRNLMQLCKIYDTGEVTQYMENLQKYVYERFESARVNLSPSAEPVSEFLDDGSKLQVLIENTDATLSFDFSGTSSQHDGNFNATPAIVKSVVLYVLRLLVDDDIPLNEGMMQNVRLILPDKSLLNPDFINTSPAVVGGNTEVSQRLCDTILKAFGLAACSQGTMNNLIFGNESFGFYETIGGGTGAGKGFDGQHAVHQHMTNTRITDPEVLELKYPVRLIKFSRRHESGGKGKWQGGDGIIRHIEFLQPVELSILSQHRQQAPYGLEGGDEGNKGEQYLYRRNGERVKLDSTAYIRCNKGDQIEIRTPGGGGYGRK
jgi:5-oxoprolinase (ATP-hydrolysing)